MPLWLWLTVHGLGFVVSLRAIMRTRTAQGAVAWVMSLNTVPLLALPAYLFFGRSKFSGFVYARQVAQAKIRDLPLRIGDSLRQNNLLAFPERQQSLLVEKLAKLPFTQGNDVELLIDGEQTFRSILQGIEQAQSYVLVQFYILRCDRLGRQLIERLIERSRAGVRCYVLYDDMGSSCLKRPLLEELRSAGVHITSFQTSHRPANRFQLNFRNHRKIVVVDGDKAWVGGFNVGDEYLGRDPAIGFWRDTHALLRGPVVQTVQVPFLEDWHWATGEMLAVDWRPEAAPSGRSMAALCLPSGPGDALETATLFFIDAIHHARQRLWIASPYFVPDEQFLTALRLAALRGVDVRVLVPNRSDNLIVDLAAWSFVPLLETAGVRFFRHQRGFMHQKVMLIDDDLATVGTANFDNRSFRLNFEVTMVIADQEFASRVETMLLRDFADSREAHGREVTEAGLWFRLRCRAALLAAPVL